MIKRLQQYGYYKFDNMPSETRYKNYFNETPLKIPEGLIIPEGLEIGVFAKLREKKNNKGIREYFYIDNFVILIYSKESSLIMFLHKYGKKYCLFPIYEQLWEYIKNLPNGKDWEVKKQIIKPNYIGVFTEKKLIDWVNYCKELIKVFKEASIESLNKQELNGL